MLTETVLTDLDLTEIINGEEMMGPSPFFKHQDIAANLYNILNQHIRKNKLGKLFFSPLDIIFEEGINRLQPDILFIRKENLSIAQDWIRGVPDMVCEIISSGSYEMDTAVKKAIYEKYRVPEYWIVMPEPQTIEVLTIVGDKYKLHSVAAIEGFVTSKVIEGLQLNITEVFE
ncbi:Uma2 family endonuclease [Candidatus Magnetomonas plexicatena]|uniref:Uma2 family endonuclease n=1 Tax=Candidatus Magnetomonas plexicatena TaxID=2552947 RepID=UPI004032FF74